MDKPMVSKEKISIFFHKVMNELGYLEWELRWMEGDAFCWRDKKIIDLCLMENEIETKQLVLHEIAHIKVIPSSGNQHNLEFFKELEILCKRFLGMGLSPYQQQFKNFYYP